MKQVTIYLSMDMEEVMRGRLLKAVKDSLWETARIEDVEVKISNVKVAKGIDLVLSDFGNMSPAAAKSIMEDLRWAVAFIESLTIKIVDIRLTMHATLVLDI